MMIYGRDTALENIIRLELAFGIRLYDGWGQPALAHGCAMFVIALEAL